MDSTTTTGASTARRGSTRPDPATRRRPVTGCGLRHILVIICPIGPEFQPSISRGLLFLGRRSRHPRIADILAPADTRARRPRPCARITPEQRVTTRPHAVGPTGVGPAGVARALPVPPTNANIHNHPSKTRPGKEANRPWAKPPPQPFPSTVESNGHKPHPEHHTHGSPSRPVGPGRGQAAARARSHLRKDPTTNPIPRRGAGRAGYG
jgi:hypothetical protein